MSTITKTIGARIRKYRLSKGLSQEKLAELCDLHMSYVGQLERATKGATLESIEKIVHGLGISYETLFEGLSPESPKPTAAMRCYQLLEPLSDKEQAAMLEMIQRIIAYKKL